MTPIYLLKDETEVPVFMRESSAVNGIPVVVEQKAKHQTKTVVLRVEEALCLQVSHIHSNSWFCSHSVRADFP